jgi:hypothetical protein
VGSIPFYEFEYKGAMLAPVEAIKCNGDCFKYLNTNFEMFWSQTSSTGKPVSNARICTADDIG